MPTASQKREALPRGTLTAKLGLPTDPVPLEPYRSEAFFEQEKEKIFRRAWLLMAREEELPSPGSFVTKTVHPLQTSIIINRSKSGKIQTFYNSCAHRGSQLVSEAEGKKSRFVCPYHHWSYNDEGALAGVPDESNFFFDKKKCGLTPVATEVWEGWIFVNMAEEPEVSLEEYLGPLKDYLSGITYIGADNPLVMSAELDSNWKVVVDAFLESYHIPAIHPKTIAETFSNGVNPYARLLDAKIFGTHLQVSMFGNSDLEPDPKNRAEQLAAGDRGSVISAGGAKETEEFLAHPAVNPTGTSEWSMDVTQVFPHTQIDWGPGGFWVHHFWPVSWNKTMYEVRFYTNKAADIRQRFQQEMYTSRVAEVILEDLVNVGRTQRGIDNAGTNYMQLQDSEVGIRHSTTRIIKWVESDSVKEALK